jgi:glutaredoxin
MQKTLVMYSRTTGCPYITIARRVLSEHNVAYDEIYIDQDPIARQHVLDWTGFLSVPTLVIALGDSGLPYTAPSDLARGSSPRGIDRGPIISEPNSDELITWLRRHELI